MATLQRVKTNKESIYRRMQNTWRMKSDEMTPKSISIADYTKKYPDILPESLEKFHEIHGFNNGANYIFKEYMNFHIKPYSSQIVLWIEDGYIHKKRYYCDELIEMCGSKTDKELFLRSFKIEEKVNMYPMFRYNYLSPKYLEKHIDYDRLQAYVNYNKNKNIKPDWSISLLRKIKVKSILSDETTI
jgi:hypothetical protein